MPKFDVKKSSGNGLGTLQRAIHEFSKTGTAIGDWQLKVVVRLSTKEERNDATETILRSMSKKKAKA